MSTTNSLTPEEIKQIAQAKKEYNEAFANGSTTMQDEAREYFDTVLDIVLKKLGGGDIPGPLPGCGPNPDPNNEHVKEGGWGGDTAGAKTWDAVPMTQDPSLFKVVDKAGKNIAHKFASEAEANTYIAYQVCKQEQGTPDPDPTPCLPGQHKDASGNCVPDAPGPTPGPAGDSPYLPKSEPMAHSIRRAIRHYASGKKDDETIEANIKNIKHDNHQFVVDITINEMMHDDTASLKHGGTHMGTGWFDEGVGIYDGQCCLGKEENHPSTQLCVVKGPKIGDIRGKRIKLAAVYFKAENKAEFWTNQGQGWIKQVEGKDIGGFNPGASTFECQLRIDGFKKGSTTGKAPEPEIHAAFVTAV